MSLRVTELATAVGVRVAKLNGRVADSGGRVGTFVATAMGSDRLVRTLTTAGRASGVGAVSLVTGTLTGAVIGGVGVAVGTMSRRKEPLWVSIPGLAISAAAGAVIGARLGAAAGTAVRITGGLAGGLSGLVSTTAVLAMASP